MRIPVALGAAAAIVVTSFVLSPSAMSDPNDLFPISYDTAFSDPLRGLSTNGAYQDREAAYELMRLVKCAYRQHDPDQDAPGYCSGAMRPKSETQNIEIQLTADRLDNILKDSWDPGSGEKKLYDGLKILLKDGGASGRFFYNGNASSKKSSPSYKLKKNVFNNKDGDTFVACKNPNKGKAGTACIAGGSKDAIMHVKALTIKVKNGAGDFYATYDQEGNKVKNAVLVTTSNLGTRSYNQSFNNTITVYNDNQLLSGMETGFNAMASRNKTKANKKVGKHQYYTGSGWPSSATGMFLGSDSALNGGSTSHSRATRVIFLPTSNTGKDPIMGLLNQIQPDDQCEIKLMHNRFKMRRAEVAEKLVELSHGGCDIELMAFKDSKAAAPRHCNTGVRICPPVMGILRQGNNIRAYSTAVHDKTMMIRARFKDGAVDVETGTRDIETVVQSGTASLTHLNIIGSDEIMTFYWDPEIYAEVREHWDMAMSRDDTCGVNLSTFKLTTSPATGKDTYCKKFN